ncbi:MAG: GatB/YqeY domain-containing protein [Actinomycetota bacterium]
MTSLLERLQHDLSAAMKAGNDAEKSTLRMAIAAVKNAAVAGDEAVTLTDAQIVGVLQAEAKKRAEAADIYKDAGRSDAEASERAELAILERYLPARVDEKQLQGIVATEVAAAAAAGLSGPKAMGQVVKAVRTKAGPGADGAQIAALVKAALAS